MKVKSKSLLSILIYALAAVFYLGCTGSSSDSSSDSSSSDYTGSTSAVELTEDNYEAVATEAYAGAYALGDMGEEVLPTVNAAVSTTTGAGSHRMFTVKDLSMIVLSVIEKSGVTEQTEDPYTLPALQSGEQTVDGSCGGTLTLDVTFTNGIRNFDVTGSFSDYCEQSVTVDGDIEIEGEYSAAESSVEMTATLTDVSISSGSTSLSINGTMGVIATTSSQTLTMTMTWTDDTSSKTYKVESLVMTTDTSQSPATFTLSGTFYNPTYGYCSLATETPFSISEATVNAGALVVSDENDASARLTITGAGTYQVELDINGDGNYDYTTGEQTW